MASVGLSMLRSWLTAVTTIFLVSFWQWSPPCVWVLCADHDFLSVRSSILAEDVEFLWFDVPNHSCGSNCRSVVSVFYSIFRWKRYAVISLVVAVVLIVAVACLAYCCYTDDMHRWSIESTRRWIYAHRSRLMFSRFQCIFVQIYSVVSSKYAVCEIHVEHTLFDRVEHSILCWNSFSLCTNLHSYNRQRKRIQMQLFQLFSDLIQMKIVFFFLFIFRFLLFIGFEWNPVWITYQCLTA